MTNEERRRMQRRSGNGAEWDAQDEAGEELRERLEPGTYRYTDEAGNTITFDYHAGRVSNVREVRK